MNQQRINKAAGILLEAGYLPSVVGMWRRWVLSGCSATAASGKRDLRRWAHYTRKLYGIKGF